MGLRIVTHKPGDPIFKITRPTVQASEDKIGTMSTQDSGEGQLFAEHTREMVGGPRFQHNAEVSLVPCIDKDHYLGTRLDNSGDPIDLYVRVSETQGSSKLVARFGHGADECIEDSLPRIYSRGAEWANMMAGVDRTYGIRMAFDAANAAGYDLRQVAAKSPEYAGVAREDGLEIG